MKKLAFLLFWVVNCNLTLKAQINLDLTHPILSIGDNFKVIEINEIDFDAEILVKTKLGILAK